MIRTLEEDARALGFDAVYLKSGSAADFYRKLGYKALETVSTQDTAAGTQTLFRKKLETVYASQYTTYTRNTLKV